MPRLIWVFAGRTVILLVLSWGGSNDNMGKISEPEHSKSYTQLHSRSWMWPLVWRNGTNQIQRFKPHCSDSWSQMKNVNSRVKFGSYWILDYKFTSFRKQKTSFLSEWSHLFTWSHLWCRVDFSSGEGFTGIIIWVGKKIAQQDGEKVVRCGLTRELLMCNKREFMTSWCIDDLKKCRLFQWHTPHSGFCASDYVTVWVFIEISYKQWFLNDCT